MSMLNHIRTISSEQQFNELQPCASDMHNGCDKCEPKIDTVEVPAQLVRNLIQSADSMIGSGGVDLFGIDLHIDKLEALLKEKSK